jgi:hypothetical protein
MVEFGDFAQPHLKHRPADLEQLGVARHNFDSISVDDVGAELGLLVVQKELAIAEGDVGVQSRHADVFEQDVAVSGSAHSVLGVQEQTTRMQDVHDPGGHILQLKSFQNEVVGVEGRVLDKAILFASGGADE